MALSRFDANAASRRGVFFDKDGTLIDDVPYNVDPARIRLAKGAAEAVRRLHSAGYRLFVVSNQSGVALGRFEESALGAVEARIGELMEGAGARLAGFACCPHHPGGVVPRYAIACDCRKPAPGMIEKLARAHGIDPARSWMVGDILDDVEAGRRAGCRAILIDNGNETEWVRGPGRLPDFKAADLAEAGLRILEADGADRSPPADHSTGARP